ncbi:MAG: hypothetical protein ABI670_22255, partial [Chloroflexota bacterium]
TPQYECIPALTGLQVLFAEAVHCAYFNATFEDPTLADPINPGTLRILFQGVFAPGTPAADIRDMMAILDECHRELAEQLNYE